jgi:hypothetical protein
MKLQWCNNLFLTLTLTTIAVANSAPKFGDRIGKLKRNFQTSTTSSTTTQPSHNFDDLNDDFNDIHRSDDYFAVDEHENKKFMVLVKEEDEKTR